MSYFLFVDESGHDRRLAPAEVLGGFIIRDGSLWSFVQAVHDLQRDILGIAYPDLNRELRARITGAAKSGRCAEKFEVKEIKGQKFLTTRVFRKAAKIAPLPPDERRRLAASCLLSGAKAGFKSPTS